MPSIIEAEQQNLVKVFSDAYFFEIPFYQRPYSWEEEQVRELLDDLIEGMERDREEPYFLGSVVLIKDHDDPRSQVVDGQQRLTTLTMLLCVLRELANPEEALLIDKSIRESANVFQGTKERFRILLREQDREFFQERIQTPIKLDNFLSEDPVNFSDSQRLFQGNASYMKAKVSELSDSHRRDLAAYVIQKCCLVVVAASEGESAHRIFQVMNDRGLALSNTDILKSEILTEISPEDQRVYADKWVDVEDSLGRDDFEDLFSHIRMIYRREKQRRTLQREFRDYVLSDMSCQEFVDDVLLPYGGIYETILDASYESSGNPDEINSLLRHLNRLDNVDWIPPAMSYFSGNKGHQVNILRFIQDLERLAYGLFIRRANINDRIRRYAQVLRAVKHGEDLFAENSPLQLTALERADILKRLDGDIYNQSRIPMPLLMRLNALLYDGKPPDNLPWATSIEHVLPQNPSSGSKWLTDFPDDEERAYLTHTLANLVLLSRRKNSQASNWDYERKKNEYFLRNNPPFALTTQLAIVDRWTPEILYDRQESLIGMLKKEWRLG